MANAPRLRIGLARCTTLVMIERGDGAHAHAHAHARARVCARVCELGVDVGGGKEQVMHLGRLQRGGGEGR